MGGSRSASKKIQHANGNGMSVHQEEAVFFQGPIPPPEIMERYEGICPGSTERILAMAESQHKHRMEIEKQAIACNIRSSDRGRLCGFAIGVIAILSGTYLGMNDHTISASIIGGGGITGLVSVFVYGARSNRKEREAKAKAA